MFLIVLLILFLFLILIPICYTVVPNSKQSKEIKTNQHQRVQDTIGRGVWSFLNMIVVKYPKLPSLEDQGKIKDLVNNIVVFYPCDVCRLHAINYLKNHSMEDAVKTQRDMKLWLIAFHNEVNKRNGKHIYTECEFDKDWNADTCKECAISELDFSQLS